MMRYGADMDDESLYGYHRRQRERMEEYEERLRKDLVLEERTVRGGALVEAHTVWLAALAGIAAAEGERTSRVRLEEVQEMELRAFSDLRRNTAVATVLLPREITQRHGAAAEEAALRRRLELTIRSRTAMLAVADLEKLEAEWRRRLDEQRCREGDPIWRAAVAQRIRFLTTPAGTHSEVHYRRFIELQERRGRVWFAHEYCLVNLLWVEEWQRLTTLRSAKLIHQWFKEAAEISRLEALGREELRLLYTPLNVDIHEEVAFRQQRVERRDRKLLALKSLRRAEMDRLVMRTDRGDAEVEYWKATELDKIADLHAQALASLVVNARDAADMVECNMARGEDGGAYDSPTSRATATAHRLEARLAALAEPNVPFAEIVAYRKKLAGFDSFVSAVEEAIGTPECLRSLPVLADTPFAVQRDDEQPFQPMQIEWRSSARTRNRPRYRAMAAATALGAREGSPYDLDSYDGVQVPHNTPPRALMWTGNDLAGDAMSLVEVPEGESAQTSIARAIRDAVYGTQRRIDLSKRDETAGSAPLDALKRRHDEQEAAELAQHVAALDALHRHLTRFV
jgi:hypothetical protein